MNLIEETKLDKEPQVCDSLIVDENESAFVKCWMKNEGLARLFEYSEKMKKYTNIKRAIFSIMSSFYIGVSYIVYFLCKARLGHELGLFVGALLFPFAIFAILYMGGIMYTSSCLMILSVVRKKHNFWKFIYQLLYAWFFNFLGSIFIIGIAWLMFNSSVTLKVLAVETSVAKLNQPWYSILASGFLCNILVAGSVYVYVVLKNEVVKYLFVYLTIFSFAIGGFQQAVANQFSIPLGVTYFDDETVMQVFHLNNPNINFELTQAQGWAAFFIYNEPLVSIANALSGVALPLIYAYAEAKKIQKNQKQTAK